MMTKDKKKQSLYKALIEKIFFDRYTKGSLEVSFARSDLEAAAKELGLALPKNLGDVVYSLRYRTPMPETVLATQLEGMEWIIEGTGTAQYAFKLVRINRIIPNTELVTIKIPDATPEIISAYALSDEQALLAKVRYNRLIDIFLGLAAYSLQNHLRTTVKGIGQIEIDEIYVGIDRQGRQYVMPVQAKGGKDQLSVIQTSFELTIEDSEVKVVEEKHYRLVPADQITKEDLARYDSRRQ